MAAVGILVIHAGPAMDKPVFSWTLMHRMSGWARCDHRLYEDRQHVDDLGRVLRRGRLPSGHLAPESLAPAGRIRRGDRHGPLPDPRAPAHLPPHRTAGKPRRYLPVWRRRSLASCSTGSLPTCCGASSAGVAGRRSGRARPSPCSPSTRPTAGGTWGLHWTTDILSGLLYGSLLLLVVIVSVRLVLAAPEPGRPGPPGRP